MASMHSVYGTGRHHLDRRGAVQRRSNRRAVLRARVCRAAAADDARLVRSPGHSDAGRRGCGTCSASPRVCSRTACASRRASSTSTRTSGSSTARAGPKIARPSKDRTRFRSSAPTGSRFAFRSDRAGPQQIFLSDGVNLRDVKRLTSGPFDVPSAWTPDGKELLFTRGFTSLGGNTDIYAVSVDQPDKPRPVVATPADERSPELSPDGKWLAYVSDDSGDREALCAAVSRTRAARDRDQRRRGRSRVVEEQQRAVLSRTWRPGQPPHDAVPFTVSGSVVRARETGRCCSSQSVAGRRNDRPGDLRCLARTAVFC